MLIENSRRFQKAEKYIDFVQLRGFEHFHPNALSGGMQQRVNLARALVTHQIDEAVQLSDRVIIFSDRSAHVIAEIEIDLLRPRSQDIRYSEEFDRQTKEIFELIYKSASGA